MIRNGTFWGSVLVPPKSKQFQNQPSSSTKQFNQAVPKSKQFQNQPSGSTKQFNQAVPKSKQFQYQPSSSKINCAKPVHYLTHVAHNQFIPIESSF